MNNRGQPEQAPPLVAVEVWFSYGQRAVLRGITLEVELGETVGLVGPNGSGKTTLLKIASGVLAQQRGTVHIQGKELSSRRPRDRARMVATVQQTPAMPQGFTAMEVVLMGRNPHLELLQWEGPGDIEVCRRVMESTDTSEFADRLVSSLSGGELQRVFIARALAQEAPLLILDEPTAHLDIRYQTGILDMIERIRRSTSITVLAAMHDLTLAAQYCSRIAVLHHGVIVAFGEPSRVLTPEVVTRVFGPQVAIVEHPVHKTPAVLPVGGVVNSRIDTPGRNEPQSRI